MVACSTIPFATRQPPSEPPQFRVAVDVVSIDAVVTDHRGDVVRDLTPADFEVQQDGKGQKVTFAEFVPVTRVAPADIGTERNAVAEAAPIEAPRVAAQPISRTLVGRTIIVLVDDLGLSVDGVNRMRRALHAFVETGLLPTDLVAIIRTGEVRGMGQALTRDDGALHAAIDALRYNNLSRKGVSPSGDVIQVGPNAPEIEEVGGLQRSMSTAGSLAALNLVVQGARDLPGRKTVIFASEGFQLAVGVDPRVRYGVDHVVDQATRAGVVIYAIDAQALQTGGLRASDDMHSIDAQRNRDAMGEAVGGLAAGRLRANRDAQESLVYLAEQTGGFAVVNTNDLAGGLGRIGNDVRDYYLIGYEPDRNTFTLDGTSPRLHRIVVNVRRPGLRVRTRKEFIGVSDPERPADAATPAQQLVRAAISPFTSATIPLRATNLPAYSGRGLFVRTVLHVDAQALAFLTTASGTRTASADLVALVFNSDGAQVDTIATGFDVTLQNAEADQAIKSGLVYTARVPIERPGGYQVRYAVRDRRSGAVGSAGGFVNVPDVRGGVFALSGLVLRADDSAAASESIDSDRFSLRAADALRVYAPGTQLKYSCEVYNASSPVQLTLSVWRGTERVLTNPAGTVTPPPGKSIALPAGGAFTLGDALPAGRYVVQLAADTTDATRRGRIRRAVQQSDFEVK